MKTGFIALQVELNYYLNRLNHKMGFSRELPESEYLGSIQLVKVCLFCYTYNFKVFFEFFFQFQLAQSTSCHVKTLLQSREVNAAILSILILQWKYNILVDPCPCQWSYYHLQEIRENWGKMFKYEIHTTTLFPLVTKKV